MNATNKPKISFNGIAPAPAKQPDAGLGAMPFVRPTAPSFARRNAMPLAIGAICALTFALGIVTTLLVTRGEQAPQVASLETAVSASLQDDVTRGQSADLLAVATPAPRAQTQTEVLAAAVIAGLQPAPTIGKLTPEEQAQVADQAASVLQNNNLRMLREGVLGGVYKVESIQKDGKKRIRLSTVNAQIGQQQLVDLLRSAAAEGKIEMPASLSTAEGDLDMDTLLFNLVQTSLANDGTPEGAEAAREMSRRAFAASQAKTKQVAGDRVYTVEPGDSLAYISLQFYGAPNQYEKIFAANRDILQSPDHIRIGQRLKIPS